MTAKRGREADLASEHSPGEKPGRGASANTANAPLRASDQDEKTRDRVRDAVLEHGPVNAARLGRLLGLTPAAVRRHLDRLEQDGVIEVKLLR
ncbi:winged helix-turn-helix transcriptional regulator, partial [Acaricomes phytoseiuli]